MALSPFIFLIIILFGCGKEGSSPGPEVAAKEEVTSTSSSELKAVTGSFINVPEAYQEVLRLIIFDHVTPKLHLYELKKDYSFSIPLQLFGQEKTYSVHLTDRVGWIGTLTFGPEKSAYIKYKGGYGFDLGQMQYPSAEFGVINPLSGSISANIGGGFSVDSGPNDALLNITPLIGISYADLSSALVIQSPLDLYHRFLAPQLDRYTISQNLHFFSQMKVNITTNSSLKYRESYIFEYDSMISKATIVDSEYQVTDNLWLTEGFQIPKIGNNFQRIFYIGKLLPLWSYTIVRLVPQDASTFFIPLVFSEYTYFPGYVYQVSDGNQSAKDLDFGSQKDANGLTSPLCIKSNLKLGLKYPQTLTYRKDAVFNSLTLSYKYFSGVNQGSKIVTPSSTDYSTEYSVEKTISQDIKWNPSSQTMSLSNISSSNTNIEISIPDDVMLKSVGGQEIHEIRIYMKFAHTKYGIESISVVRLSHTCV